MRPVKYQRRSAGNCFAQYFADAAGAAGAGAAPKADTMRSVGDDVVAMVATYCDCKALCRLGSVSRRFRHIPSNDMLWKLRALDILPLAQMESAKAAFGFACYRHLVETFTRIGIPHGVLGFWRGDGPIMTARETPPVEPEVAAAKKSEGADRTDGHGELLRISYSSGGFLGESISPAGTSHAVFTIAISMVGQSVKIGYFCLEDPNGLPVTMGGDGGWIPGQTIPEAFLASAVPLPTPTERAPPVRASGDNGFFLERFAGHTSRFTHLKAPSAAAAAAVNNHGHYRPAAEMATLDLCGLWCAPYGSHGLEIIQLSVDYPNLPPSSGVAAAAAAAGTKLSSRGGHSAAAAGIGARQTMEGKPKPVGAAFECDASQKTASSSASACTSRLTDDGSDDDDDDVVSVDSTIHTEDFVEFRDEEDSREDVAAEAAAAAALAANQQGSNTAFEAKEAREGCNSSNATVRSSEESKMKYDDPCCLFGIKVTGDSNVPAGKLSFVVMDNNCDVDEELEADRRPVVLFTSSGAVMANLSNRRPWITMWRKARGQINRTPGLWSPEWVDVDFVAYQPGARCAFSVVFRQPSEAVSVILDFERVLGTKEAWPEWSSVSLGSVNHFSGFSDASVV